MTSKKQRQEFEARQRLRNEEFQDLVDLHETSVRAVAFRRCNDYDIAEDATHVAFIRLWKELERGEKIDNRLGWLCRVAGNEAINQLKSKRRRGVTHPPEFINSLPAGEASVLHALERREETEEIRQAFAALPNDYLEFLERKQHQTRAEIADEKGLTERQVIRKLTKARKRLRLNLKE